MQLFLLHQLLQNVQALQSRIPIACRILSFKGAPKIHHQKPRSWVLVEVRLRTVRAKVGGHDICALVYVHSIVFCLDFHQGERYLRKRGRKWDENKGRGREPSVMEPAPNWSGFSHRRVDMAPPLLLTALASRWALSNHLSFQIKAQTTMSDRNQWMEGSDATCFCCHRGRRRDTDWLSF